jgi:hypothetical protein
MSGGAARHARIVTPKRPSLRPAKQNPSVESYAHKSISIDSVDLKQTTAATGTKHVHRLTVLAERLPHHILACIFEFLPLKDMLTCMRICRHWYSYLSYEVGDLYIIIIFHKQINCF